MHTHRPWYVGASSPSIFQRMQCILHPEKALSKDYTVGTSGLTEADATRRGRKG